MTERLFLAGACILPLFALAGLAVILLTGSARHPAVPPACPPGPQIVVLPQMYQPAAGLTGWQAAGPGILSSPVEETPSYIIIGGRPEPGEEGFVTLTRTNNPPVWVDLPDQPADHFDVYSPPAIPPARHPAHNRQVDPPELVEAVRAGTSLYALRKNYGIGAERAARLIKEYGKT